MQTATNIYTTRCRRRAAFRLIPVALATALSAPVRGCGAGTEIMAKAVAEAAAAAPATARQRHAALPRFARIAPGAGDLA